MYCNRCEKGNVRSVIQGKKKMQGKTEKIEKEIWGKKIPGR